MATPSLATWQHARVRTIQLPSGAGDVDIEPCDSVDFLYGDPAEGIEAAVPNELAAIAEKVEYEGVEPEKLSNDERIQLSRYRHWLIAFRLRRPKLTASDVRTLPYEDQIAMFRVATHSDLSERVMLASFRGVEGGVAGNGSGPAAKGAAK